VHPSDPRGGGTAFYDASSSTPASGVVAFDYSVWSGQTTSDLAVADRRRLDRRFRRQRRQPGADRIGGEPARQDCFRLERLTGGPCVHGRIRRALYSLTDENRRRTRRKVWVREGRYQMHGQKVNVAGSRRERKPMTGAERWWRATRIRDAGRRGKVTDFGRGGGGFCMSCASRILEAEARFGGAIERLMFRVLLGS